MVDERPQADRILIARLTGTARYHARWRDLTAEEETTAVAELRELAAGRTDLLAQVCGVMLGFHEGELDEPLTRQAAMLCREAGADAEAIPGWVEEGRRRRAAARMPPMSGGLWYLPVPCFSAGFKSWTLLPLGLGSLTGTGLVG